LARLGVPRGKRHPAGQLSIQADLEGILPRPRQRNVENQNGAGLYIYHSGGRLSELHRAFSAEKLAAALIHESNPDGMNPDLRAAPSYPEDQVGPGVNGWEVGEPDMLKDAEDAELALLIDQSVIGDYGEIEMQLS
jgi:hypothetical protein